MDWQEGRGSRVEKEVDERRMQAREKRVSSKKYDNNRGYIIV